VLIRPLLDKGVNAFSIAARKSTMLSSGILWARPLTMLVEVPSAKMIKVREALVSESTPLIVTQLPMRILPFRSRPQLLFQRRNLAQCKSY
jgi:hypothetical protein